MTFSRLKSLLVAVFSLFLLSFFHTASAQPGPEGHEGGAKKKFNASEVIFGHVLNGHEFHFLGASIPLPVIVYAKGKGFSWFMSICLSSWY